MKKATCTLQKLSLCRSASIVTVILLPPKTATQPSHIVTLFISQTDFTPIVTAFVLITYPIFIKQTPGIDIQLHSQCICFHINAEKFDKLRWTATPFGIFICNFAGDIFKQWFGRQLPKFCFSSLKLPHKSFGIATKINFLVRLVSARNFKRCRIACTLFFP